MKDLSYPIQIAIMDDHHKFVLVFGFDVPDSEPVLMSPAERSPHYAQDCARWEQSVEGMESIVLQRSLDQVVIFTRDPKLIVGDIAFCGAMAARRLVQKLGQLASAGFKI